MIQHPRNNIGVPLKSQPDIADFVGLYTKAIKPLTLKKACVTKLLKEPLSSTKIAFMQTYNYVFVALLFFSLIAG
jgi:hypothetical protein